MRHVGLGLPVRKFDDADELISAYLQHPEIVNAFVAYSMPPDVVISLLKAFMGCVTLYDTKDLHITLKQMELLLTPTGGYA